MSGNEVTITTPSKTFAIGSEEEVQTALQAISRVTGGSSNRGAWSLVWGLSTESNEMSEEHVKRLSLEARDVRAALAHALPREARTFLDRLARLND